MRGVGRPFRTGSVIARTSRGAAPGLEAKARRRCPWTKFAGARSLRGGACRQGGRKVRPQKRAGRRATPRGIGESRSRPATGRESATIIPDESGHRGRRGYGVEFPALPFASCFAYLPGGHGAACEEGRLLCARLKAVDRDWLPRFAAQVWLEVAGHGQFIRAFGRGVVLVPVPGSSPARCPCWVGGWLAGCLREVGLASEVWPILRRRHAVRKSAFAAAGERPSLLEHYASFAVERGSWGKAPVASGTAAASGTAVDESAHGGLRLTLVDDVITRGRTLLAAAARLHEAFPAAQIRAFALLRTLERGEVLRQILDPCEGEVRRVCDDARRRP